MDTTPRPFAPRLLWLLRVSTFLTLFCRGWIYLRWDSPLRGLFWHESWMTKPVEHILELNWAEYTAGSDAYLSLLFRVIGIFLMVSGGAALFVTPSRRRLCDVLTVATGFTLLHAFCSWLGKDWQIGMLMELGLQAGSPALLLLAIRCEVKSIAFVAAASVLTAFTFIGHGLYAVGHHPVPADFVSMSTQILGISESQAVTFLVLAGYLDFIAAFLIFLPIRTLRMGALFYMVWWGFVTAMARIVAHYNPSEKFYGIDPWLAETLVRTPHWAVPLALALLLWKRETNQLSS